MLEIFHELYPKAPVFTITHDKSETGNAFKDMEITTSFIQRLPGGPRRYKWYLAWMPAAIEQFDLSKYDVVLSDCSAYSKGVITKPDTLHICYCHSPTRYLWSDTHAYTEELKQPSVIKKGLPLILNKIRVWDKLASERVDNFVANSKNVQDRIKKYYNRSSDVIYPPVDTSNFNVVSKNDIGDYYLIVSRLRPYKRVDIAIEAFNALELPLKVIGTGEEYKKLRKLANKNIEFLGYIKDSGEQRIISTDVGLVYVPEEALLLLKLWQQAGQ